MRREEHAREDRGAPTSNELTERLRQMFPALAAMPTLPARLAAAGTFRDAAAGTVMFSQHTPCSGFPLLLGGTVRVVQRYPNGRELQLYRVKPGELCVLSGSCLLSDVEYQATGIAETDVQLLIVPPETFRELLARDEGFRRYVFGGFGSRLAEVMQVVEAIANRQLDARLARLLLDSADRGGTVHLTHQALADDLGSVREIVSRLLRTFEDRQWVSMARERITIENRPALQELASHGSA